MKKILLVGSNGLVGSHFNQHYGEHYHITNVSRQNDDLNTLADDFDALVFLAQSKEYTSKEFTEDLFNINVSLVRKYLEKLAGKCKQVILFSTGSVYQDSMNVIDENSPLMTKNLTPYVASKQMAEILAKSFHPFYENISIVRPFCIYGKGQRASMLFSRLINNIRNKASTEIGQANGILFNPVHADDVAHFIDYIISRCHPGIEYLNIAGPEILSLMDVVQKIGDLLKQTPQIVVREDWPFKKSVATSINHNFAPTTTLEKGLLNTFDFAW